VEITHARALVTLTLTLERPNVGLRTRST